eukprot:gene19681-24116_t
MTLNDFKSIEGDTRTGVRSLPVQLGAERAALVACWVMAIPQAVVIALLFAWGEPIYALIIVALLGGQVAAMVKMLRDPKKLAPWYNATGIGMYVLGMLASAIAAKALRRSEAGLSWISIVRLGLVQTALGAIIVLTTSTLNRVMVVEYALPAMLPGVLV